jgi:lauroyl/myristoyl acyltransferase
VVHRGGGGIDRRFVCGLRLSLCLNGWAGNVVCPDSVKQIGNMKNRLKDTGALFFVSIIRRAERNWPVKKIYPPLKMFALARAALNTAFKNPRPCVPLPDCLKSVWTLRASRQKRMNGYLNLFVQYFQDRLADAKWKKHCRILGFEHLQLARQNGRPVVLAFCHFGPFFLLRSWLRAAEIPAAVMVGGKSESRAKLMRRLAEFAPFPEIPTVFHPDRLREATGFLAAGNPLLIAMDDPAGKQMDVPFCEGWTFRMATGAVRLAIRHQAELIPCSIIDEGRWHFRIELGRPVPREFLTAKSDWSRAGKHLLDEMLPHFQAHPEQCGRNLIICLKKNSSVASSRI